MKISSFKGTDGKGITFLDEKDNPVMNIQFSSRLDTDTIKNLFKYICDYEYNSVVSESRSKSTERD